jgi:hypothetical protein
LQFFTDFIKNCKTPRLNKILSFISECRYDRGDWTTCDVIFQLKNRTDILKASSRGNKLCADKRVVTKKCNEDGINKGF